MCNALLSYIRRLGTQTWNMWVRRTTQVKNMIMKTVTSLHDVGREESWALLDDQNWKMVVVLNATVYGVMKRCLKKKKYTVDKFLGTTVNHDTSRTNVASTCIEQERGEESTQCPVIVGSPVVHTAWLCNSPSVCSKRAAVADIQAWKGVFCMLTP